MPSSQPARPSPSKCSSTRTSQFHTTRVDRKIGPGAPTAAPPAVRSAGSHGVRRTSLHRWSRSTAAFPYRQDTRVGASRQSAPTNTPQPDASAHTATARDPGVSAGVEDAGIWHPLRFAPCSPDTVDRRSCCGHIPGPGCWVRGPTFGPSSAANGPRPIPGSRSHVRQHSGVGSIVLSWQHHSPSRLAVLHLELALKE